MNEFVKNISLLGTFLLLFLAALASPQSASAQAAPPQAKNYKLAFDEEFDKLDLSPDGLGVYTWYPGIWFNHKRTMLSNIRVSDSALTLAWRNGQPSADTSIETLSHDRLHAAKTFRYGYFEARAKWTPVKGAWPSFWMIPVQDANGQSTRNGIKESGEIDIFEGQGEQPHTYFGTIHDWIQLHDHANRENHYPIPADQDFSQFHTYGLLWVPGRVTWYFDNQPLHSEPTPAVFDVEDYFLVLGMQEGVNWVPGNQDGLTEDKLTFTVDWVRVWQK